METPNLHKQSRTTANEPAAEQCGAVSGGWHSPNLQVMEAMKRNNK
jgi:hypothetical protein